MKRNDRREWIEFAVPWLFEQGLVRILCDPQSVSREALQRLVHRNEMTQPYIVETMSERRLHFRREATQTTMSLDDPDALVAPYLQKMMSFLLFNPHPSSILMVGLGGGALPKFCYRRLPSADITVVEMNPDVVALRDEFHVPHDDARFRVLTEDGAKYIKRLREPIDVILVDAFDADGIAPSLANSDFYSNAAKCLSASGMLIMNLWGKRTRLVESVVQARRAFENGVVFVPVTSGANILLFALKQPAPRSIDDEMASHAQRLQSKFQLDFPQFLRRICQGNTADHLGIGGQHEIAS